MSSTGPRPTDSQRRDSSEGGRPGPVAPGGRGDWEWRRKVRANPASLRIYRVVVAVVGAVVVIVGVLLLPLPGPGWVIIFLGIGVWASEFTWAKRLLQFAKDKVRDWTEWTRRQLPAVKAAIGLATAVLVLAVVFGYLKWQGAPGLLPDGIEGWLTGTFGLPS